MFKTVPETQGRFSEASAASSSSAAAAASSSSSSSGAPIVVDLTLDTDERNSSWKGTGPRPGRGLGVMTAVGGAGRGGYPSLAHGAQGSGLGQAQRSGLGQVPVIGLDVVRTLLDQSTALYGEQLTYTATPPTPPPPHPPHTTPHHHQITYLSQ